jgi:two-component system sensor histidine kinase/response regulator
VLVVRDDGMGISEEMLPKIFDMYSRASMPAHGTDDGLGIGLALVKGLVELHQGKLTIESALGRGTIVTVWFPPERALLLQRRARSQAG